MAESTSSLVHPYDIFLVHSSDDKETAHVIDLALNEKGFKTYAHYKEGVDFPAGRPIFHNIINAVNESKIILILLTKVAMKSHWVTFEVLMGLEKSHRESKMCVRLVFQGVSEEERTEFKKGAYHNIPDVVIDFNKDGWKDDLADKVNEEVQMRDLLPAGNVAHGLVYNYYIGFLGHVLPATADAVAKCDYSKQGKFSQKFFIIIPESCKISPLDGRHGEYTIEKMKTPLDMDVIHGDKKRKYNPSVYRITKAGSVESYFFAADVPFIIATMSKMNEMGFVQVDLHFQMVRFKLTLMDVVQHPQNSKCKDTATFISYKDTSESPALSIWENLVKEFTEKTSDAGAQTVLRKAADMETNDGKPITATITHFAKEADQNTATEIMNFLDQKNVKFHNGGDTMHFKILDEARWNIFVISESAVKDDVMNTQFEAALEYSISDNEVQVIPVLASGSDIEKIPYNFKWTTMLKQDEPDYLGKLWQTMQERRKVLEMITSGKVYEGLAYAYLINYLPYNLTEKTLTGRDFKERFIDAKVKYNVTEPCVAKMFVIVPKSCSFPAPGSSFENEEHLGPLEPVTLGPRKYFLQMYRLTLSNGKKVCYAREYATPAIALHDMSQLPFAGLNKEEMNKQAKEFAEFSNKIMKHELFNQYFGDIRDKCEMVYFDDEELGMEGVLTALEERLQKCLKDGNCIV